jgi:hypothetical protein
MFLLRVVLPATVLASYRLLSAAAKHPLPELEYSATISSPSINDGFGAAVSVSSDGQSILVGAPNASSGVGGVYSVSYNGEEWAAPQALPIQANPGDAAGTALSMLSDGRSAAFGSPGANSQRGAVLVFDATRQGWEQATTLTATDPTGITVSALGSSLAWSPDGTMLFVGAPSSDVNGAVAAGAGVVFAAWPPPFGQLVQASVLAFGAASAGAGAFSVVASSYSGYVLAAGAPSAEAGAGAASIFSLNQSGKVHKLPPAPVAAPSSLRVSGGSTDVAGVPHPPRQALNWQETPLVPPTPLAPGSAYGSSVALSGDGGTVAVGAPGAPGGGAVLLFVLKSACRPSLAAEGGGDSAPCVNRPLNPPAPPSWVYAATLTASLGSVLQARPLRFPQQTAASSASAPSAAPLFGVSVALSFRGTAAFVGAVVPPGSGGALVDGAVYPFTMTDPQNASSWGPVPDTQPWQPPRPYAGEGFSGALACNGADFGDVTACVVGTLGPAAGAGTSSDVYVWTAQDGRL